MQTLFVHLSLWSRPEASVTWAMFFKNVIVVRNLVTLGSLNQMLVL